MIPAQLSQNQKVGHFGEVWVARQLIKQDYSIRMPHDFSESWDLTINGVLDAEVKLSQSRTNYNRKRDKTYLRFQWNVSSVKPGGVLFMLAKDAWGKVWPFIMPSEVMVGRQVFEINSHPAKYRGITADYLNKWQTVDYLLVKAYQNGGQLCINDWVSQTEGPAHVDA